MKPKIRLNILPLYRCNQECTYCLYKHLHNNPNTLDIVWLDKALTSLSHQYEIVQVEIGGGEIALLSDFYFEMIFNLAKIHCKKIIASTNFVKFNKALINNCDIINVSYNFNEFSPLKQHIFKNIQAAVNSGKVINIKSLDISCQIDQSQIIEQLNILKIKSWEIVPYHPSFYSTPDFIDYSFFENTVKTFLKLASNMKFAFQNKLQLEGILPIDNYNIQTVYLTPNNNFALLDFDNNNKVYLSEYKNIIELQANLEELEKLRDDFCKNCTSKLKCMANKFLNLKYKGNSCSGFKNLIQSTRLNRK